MLGPGVIRDALDSTRRGKMFLQRAIADYFREHPVAAGSKGDRGDQGAKGDTGDRGQRGPDGPPGSVFLGQVTLAETSILNAQLGVRRVTATLAGTTTGQSYLAIPINALPVGFSVQDAVCSTNGQITVGVLVPVIQLLGSYSIPVRIYRLNQ